MIYGLRPILTLSATLLLAAGATSASAADLGGFKGSIKDDNYAPMPQVSLINMCYVRIDTGYGWSGDPDVKWAVNNRDDVRNIDFDNSWMVEGGVGCGTGGSRGWRGELALGYHGKRDYAGEPGLWTPPGEPGGPIDDPLHTSISSTTLMVNLYKDLGNYGGLIPYVGAGVGVAYNKMDDVSFTGNPALINRIEGDEDLSFAWSLMAGVGYQLSPRTTLDIGYRYLNLGDIESEHIDSARHYNPKVKFDDLDVHEIKVGLRYQFGGPVQ